MENPNLLQVMGETVFPGGERRKGEDVRLSLKKRNKETVCSSSLTPNEFLGSPQRP